MKKEIKEKKKKLEKRYSDYLYEVLRFLQKQNLSKYAYYDLRDEAIEDIYEGQINEENPEHIFHHGYETFFQKRINKLPQKNIIEKISSLVFVFFIMFSFFAIIIYLYRFTSNVSTFISKGIYLYVTPSNLGTMCTYGFLGSIVSLLIQRNDKRTKYISIIITSAIGLAIVVSLFALGANVERVLKLNMIVVEIVGISLSIGGFFVEDIISKRKCKVKSQAN